MIKTYHELVSINKTTLSEAQAESYMNGINIIDIYTMYNKDNIDKIYTIENEELSDVFKSIGIEINDNTYTEIHKSNLKRAGKELLIRLENIIKISKEDSTREDRELKRKRVIDIIREITRCLVEIDLDTSIILYK